MTWTRRRLVAVFVYKLDNWYPKGIEVDMREERSTFGSRNIRLE